jgi:hypothetical protein
MSVRDRGRAAEIAEIQKQLDAGTAEPERIPYSGAGSAFMGKIGQPLQDTSGMTRRQIAEQKARGEFAFEVDERPAIEALAKAIAEDQARVLANHQQTAALIKSGENLDALWAMQGHKNGCPLLAEFERGDAAGVNVNAFGMVFDAFIASPVFAKYRHQPIEKEVCEILYDWMLRQMISPLSASNWARLLGMFEGVGYILPTLPEKPVAPSLESRVVYKVAGHRYTGRAALDSMPSKEYERRMKEEPDFPRIADALLSGRSLEEVGQTKAQAVPQDPYSYNTSVILRGFKGYGDLTRRQIDELSSSDYRAAMRLIGTPVPTMEQVRDAEDGYILAHLEQRRLQWAR